MKRLLLVLLISPLFYSHSAPTTDKGGITLPPAPKAYKTLPMASLGTVQQVSEVEVAVVPVYASTGGATNCGSDPYLAQIYQMESGCCPTKWQGEHVCPDTYEALYDVNTPGLGYGLCQSTPAGKMATAGSDWQTNWNTQNSWCLNYANQRYGSPAAAWAHWQQFRNW